MGTLKGLIDRGMAEEGYIEKASNANLDSKTANRGSNNYTKYSRDVINWGLMGCQGQPWCCTFQFWLDAMEYGLEEALEHWNMTRSSYVGYNCFATYNAFKKAGKVGTTPKLGAVPIFDFSHAGRVVRIYSKNGQKWWDCLEGNTSSNLSDRNGGQVKIKTRPWKDSSVKGFCYIDYVTEPEKKSGWYQENGGWRFYLGDTGEPVRNAWYKDGEGWYWFDGAGMMVRETWKTGSDGKWYYLGRCGKMLKNTWVVWKNELYRLNEDGSMFEGEIHLQTDSKGALH